MTRIYLSPPHMGPEERRLLLEAFDSNWIAPLGPHVDAFEREMCEKLGVRHAAALSSGTAALHLALINLGVGAGDNVLCSTLTFSATANAVVYVGATPIFIDAIDSSWCIDPSLLADEIEHLYRSGKSPKAVITVDLYGQCCDYEKILEVCNRYGIYVVEDAAEALGATYQSKSAGSFGAMGVLSFNGNKIITTSGGGMLLSDNKDWVDKARFLSTQARDPAPHYQHSHIGYNYRMSNLLAAVGRGQLRVLDKRVRRRREVNALYHSLLGDLPGISFMPEASYGRANRWLTCITVDERLFGASREDIRLALENVDVEARPVWKPMHRQPIFSGYRFVGSGVADRLFDRGLCLPSGTRMTDENVAFVAGIVRSVSKGKRS
jgi:dTDP-4-amino-4,6-dideoxygalactose transaminase